MSSSNADRIVVLICLMRAFLSFMFISLKNLSVAGRSPGGIWGCLIWNHSGRSFSLSLLIVRSSLLISTRVSCIFSGEIRELAYVSSMISCRVFGFGLIVPTVHGGGQALKSVWGRILTVYFFTTLREADWFFFNPAFVLFWILLSMPCWFIFCDDMPPGCLHGKCRNERALSQAIYRRRSNTHMQSAHSLDGVGVCWSFQLVLLFYRLCTWATLASYLSTPSYDS